MCLSKFRIFLLCTTALICGGCGDESEIVQNELASNLLRSQPPDGGFLAISNCQPPDYQPVTLFFDRLPASVTVNGTPAKIENRLVTWRPKDLVRGQPNRLVTRGTIQMALEEAVRRLP